MPFHPFQFSGTPRLHYGPGSRHELARILDPFAGRIMLVTGGHSLERNGHLERIMESLRHSGFAVRHERVEGEPNVTQVDSLAKQARQFQAQCILAIGGGSVIDAGKAVSAMVCADGSIADYLEGVGGQSYNGSPLPFVAVPTTAGTGSEATKNAVLSGVDSQGKPFKRSLRHETLIPLVAVIDPELALATPRALTVACALDALSQLLESYTSIHANALSDAFAQEGLRLMADHLENVCRGHDSIEGRGAIALAAFCSGVALAHAGLGLVHGIAGHAGAMERRGLLAKDDITQSSPSTSRQHINAPHGVLCGALVAPCFEATVRWLRDHARLPQSTCGLEKMARAGSFFKGDQAPIDRLITTLWRWTEDFQVPNLLQLGFIDDDLQLLAQVASNRNSPAQLSVAEITSVLQSRT